MMKHVAGLLPRMVYTGLCRWVADGLSSRKACGGGGTGCIRVLLNVYEPCWQRRGGGD